MAAHSTTSIPGGTLTIVQDGPHKFRVLERDSTGGNPRHVKTAYHKSEAEAYVRARQHGKTRRQVLAGNRAKVRKGQEHGVRTPYAVHITHDGRTTTWTRYAHSADEARQSGLAAAKREWPSEKIRVRVQAGGR